MDHTPLTDPRKQRSKQSGRLHSKDKMAAEPNEHDDFAGVIINAGKSINVREMIMIWLWFLIIHSEIFIHRVLSRINGACDSEDNLTMAGTVYASFAMIIGVILIDMLYR